MAIHWQFIEDNEPDSIHWTWRSMRVNDTIARQSSRFESYAAVVSDAIHHGLRLQEEHWIVVTPSTVTHFCPGSRPVTVPVAARTGTDTDVLQRLRGMSVGREPRRYLALPNKKAARA
jgi:hypothetical protein